VLIYLVLKKRKIEGNHSGVEFNSVFKCAANNTVCYFLSMQR